MEAGSVKQLTPPLRKLWIDVEFTRISAASANQDSYRNIARKLVQGIADDVKATLDVTALRFGGNIDAAKIRDVCTAHGISHKTDKRTQGGEKLLVVKNRRNALAPAICRSSSADATTPWLSSERSRTSRSGT